MKKIVVTLLCSLMAVSLFSAEAKPKKEEVEKKIAELKAERAKIRNTLIQQRRAAIRQDKHAAKLAREILTLNQELSEYLDTFQNIKALNKNLSNIDRRIQSMQQYLIDLEKEEKKKDAKK